MLCKVLLLAAIVAVASAQTFRCKMPQQWEARVIAFDPNRRMYRNHTSTYFVRARYAYDGINFRKARFEDVVVGQGDEERLEILELFQEKKAYVTNFKTRECKIYPMDHWHAHDIPADAQFVGYEYLGAYPNQFELSQWFNYETHYGLNSSSYKTFTESTCAPTRDDHFNNATGFHYEQFSDVTLGFHDPNIWIPSPNCQPAKLE